VGGGGLISGLACGVQCRCRTRPCHRQNRPPLRARGYDAVVSRLAVSRVFRGDVAYIIATDPPTHLSWSSFSPKHRIIFFSDPYNFLFSRPEKNRGIVGTQKNYSTVGARTESRFPSRSPLAEITHSISCRSFFSATVFPRVARKSVEVII